MTAVEFNHQQIKFCDYPQFKLDDIDERCGEIYITLNGTLIFHCSLCAISYGSVDNFLDHLTKQHFKDVKDEEEIKNDCRNARSDIEGLLEDYSNDKLCQEQKLVNDDDCDVDADVKVGVEDDDNDDDDEDDDDDDGDDEDDDDDDDDDDYDDDGDDVNDDDIDAYEEMLQRKEVAGRTNSEHNFDESKEIDADKIKNETEIEITDIFLQEQTFGTQNPKPKRQYRKNMNRQYICKQCGKEYQSNLSLRRHYLTHSDIRKYKCKICDFAFKDRSNLDSHVRRHLGINKIECGYCPKTFFTQTEVKSHRRVHTGERPYVCSICGKAYTTPHRLKVHMKRHTSEPSFKCDYCQKGFYERFRYEDHKLVHTKQKQFVCEICAATFPRHKSWSRHAKLHESSTKEVKPRYRK